MAQTSTASEPPAAPTRARSRLFTRTFVLVCVAGFFGYAHMALLTPTIPLFIQEQGGSASFVGLVLAAFSATSFVLRPFIGRAVDAWSARGILGISTVILGLAGLAYLVYHPLILLAVRAGHGIGWAGYNTSLNVLVARIAPAARRGEAVGYLGMALSIAIALVPGLGLWLLGWIGFAGLFCISAAAGLLAAGATAAMPAQPRPGEQSEGGGFWHGLVERSALLASSLQYLTMLAHPAVVVFIPMYAGYRGIAVESLLYYYLGYGLASIAARVVFGRWSDRVGRGWAIAVGTGLLAVALLVLSQATDIGTLTLSAVLSGIGVAASSPALMALAIDRSRPEKRGAAMATYSMSFQLADGVGGLLWGVVIELMGYSAMYLVATLAPVAALLVLARHWRAANPDLPAPSEAG